jgi:hypothetical protein
MRTSVLVLVVVIVAGLATGPALLQESGPMGPSPYNVVDEWMTPFAADGYAWGSHPGVAIDSPNRIFVIQRGEFRLPDPLPSEFAGFVGSIGLNALRPEGARVWKNCIFIVNSDGDLVETWDQWDHLFEGSNGPHKIRISPYDSERRIWVVHETGHQVFAFSNDGSELLMTLGEKDVGGNDETHFGRPQDVAFMPDGRILVADGLDNSRVVMFDPEGAYITHFGEKGIGRGEFDGVHAVATSADGRIYVADRNNARIQVFNETTRAAAWYHPNIAPIGVWPGFDFPNDIIINGYNVWIADNQPPKIIRTDLNGNREYTWDIAGEGPGQYRELHQFAVDENGNWYGADNVMGRTLKFEPKADANSVDLIRMQESATGSNP